MNRRVAPRWIALLFVPILAASSGAALAATSDAPWLHVRVLEAGGAERVSLNLPLSLAESLLDLAGEERVQAKISEALPEELDLDRLRATWKELSKVSAADLLDVQNEGESIKLSLAGEHLRVDVKETGDEAQTVSLRVPRRLVDALLGGQGNRLDLRAALKMLQTEPQGELVTVDGTKESVRVWVE